MSFLSFASPSRPLRQLVALLAGALLALSVQAQEPPRTVELQVDGLVCAFCAQGISKRLGKMDATQDVFVSLENGLVAVALKPGQDLGDEALRTALTEAGYSVRGISRSQDSLDAVRARVAKAQP